MMKEKEREQIRVALVLEKERLLRNAHDGLAFSMNRERNIGRDSIDESMEEEQFSTELRLRDREKFMLAKIRGALERLDARLIDQCEDCGEPIGFKRLLARPVTTLCIECKEEREREEQTQSPLGRIAATGVEGDLGGAEEQGSDEG